MLQKVLNNTTKLEVLEIIDDTIDDLLELIFRQKIYTNETKIYKNKTKDNLFTEWGWKITIQKLSDLNIL